MPQHVICGVYIALLSLQTVILQTVLLSLTEFKILKLASQTSAIKTAITILQ